MAFHPPQGSELRCGWEACTTTSAFPDRPELQHHVRQTHLTQAKAVGILLNHDEASSSRGTRAVDPGLKFTNESGAPLTMVRVDATGLVCFWGLLTIFSCRIQSEAFASYVFRPGYGETLPSVLPVLAPKAAPVVSVPDVALAIAELRQALARDQALVSQYYY
jgi:hypothetical protein